MATGDAGQALRARRWRTAVGRYVRMYVAPPRYRRARRLALTAADGVRLNAWFLPAGGDALATVVLVHGFVNSSRSPGIHRFAHLLARRAHVVVPDLRGHGGSGGLCSMGRDEPLDVAAAVAAAPDGLPVVTVGTSLGGAAVFLHAGTFGGVAGVVGISSPAWGELDRAGTHRVRRLVAGRAGRAMVATFLRTRVADECSFLPQAAEAVARIAPAFTIVVHDPDDWYFGPAHAESIHAWAGEPKALWWYPGGGHGGDLLTPELAERLLGQLEAWLNPAGPPFAPPTR